MGEVEQPIENNNPVWEGFFDEALTALGVFAILGLGVWQFSTEPTGQYAEVEDPLKVIKQHSRWELEVHNSGPETDAIAFYYAPKQQAIYCQLHTHFSQDESRTVENVCPVAATAAQTKLVDFVVLPAGAFEKSNWRDALYP